MGSLCNIVNGSDLRDLYLKWFHPIQDSIEEALENCVVSKGTEEVAEMEGVTIPSSDANVNGLDTPSDGGMEFYITDDKGSVKKSKILMNDPLTINGELRLLHVLVCWSEKQIKKYDTRLCSSLPEVCKSGFSAKRPQESVSLYKCLEAFLQEEPLGPEDMWLVTVFIVYREVLLSACLLLSIWEIFSLDYYTFKLQQMILVSDVHEHIIYVLAFTDSTHYGHTFSF